MLRASELLYEKYRHSMQGIIGSHLMTEASFYEKLHPILKDAQSIHIEEKGQRGAVYFHMSEKEGTRRCQIPLFGYAANDEQMMVKLFQKMAERVVSQGSCIFSVQIYSKDIECLRAFLMMQFSLMLEKGMMKVGSMLAKKTSISEINVLTKTQIEALWPELWTVTHQLISHLQKSPIFYPCKEFTEAMYRAFFMDESAEVIIAKHKGKIVGLIERNREPCEVIEETYGSMNVGEIFVEPEYRGTGLADQLLRTAEQRAKNDGHAYLWVEHGTANPNARGFWNKYFETYAYELVRMVDYVD